MVKEGKPGAKRLANRLMGWGLVLGSLLGGVQLLVLPFINVFTPLPAVQKAARVPSIIASFLQIINGVVFIGEGIMQGEGMFLPLALNNVAAATGMVFALKILSAKYGLNGVWLSFGVFNGIRLAGVIIHQVFLSELSARKMKKAGLEGKLA